VRNRVPLMFARSFTYSDDLSIRQSFIKAIQHISLKMARLILVVQNFTSGKRGLLAGLEFLLRILKLIIGLALYHTS
jgi:hypothetical protein